MRGVIGCSEAVALALQGRLDTQLDVTLQRARDRAAIFGSLGGFLERIRVDAGHFSSHGQLAGRNLEAIAHLVEGHGGAYVESLWRMALTSKSARERHRIAARMGC